MLVMILGGVGEVYQLLVEVRTEGELQVQHARPGWHCNEGTTMTRAVLCRAKMYTTTLLARDIELARAF